MIPPKCAILLIGDELTTGQISDTNGSWLAGAMTELGAEVPQMLVVRDRLDEIVEALRRTGSENRIVLVTGGLGPTADDITRDAFALLMDVELVEHPASIKKIEERYRARGIPMNAPSQRQAMFPAGSAVINNSAGTADGFLVDHAGALFVSFPGVPLEMKRMFDEEVLPLFKTTFPSLRKPAASVLRCFGVSESAIGAAVESCKLSSELNVSYRAHFPEVYLKFSGSHATHEQTESAAALAAEAIGRAHIISADLQVSLAAVVLQLLKKNGLTVAFAESCTGGLCSSLLVSEPGASDVLTGGIVCYSNQLKKEFAGVSPRTIDSYGAVSRETALELAGGIRKATGSSIGISTTGIAGPGGGTPDKPVGTVFFGYSRDGTEESVRHFLPFERNRFRHYAAHLALDLIRRDLLGLPLTFERR